MAEKSLIPAYLFGTSLPRMYVPIVLSDCSDCSSVSAVSDALQTGDCSDSTLTPTSSLESSPASTRQTSPSTDSTRSTLSYRPSSAGASTIGRGSSLSPSFHGSPSKVKSAFAGVSASKSKTGSPPTCAGAPSHTVQSSALGPSEPSATNTTSSAIATHTETGHAISHGASTFDRQPAVRKRPVEEDDKKPWLIEWERRKQHTASKRHIKTYAPSELALFVRIGNRTQPMRAWKSTTVYSVKVRRAVSDSADHPDLGCLPVLPQPWSPGSPVGLRGESC